MSGALESAALGWSHYFTAAVWASLGVPGAERFDTRGHPQNAIPPHRPA